MNIQNTKKTVTLLFACALVMGGAVGASAAEPSKEADHLVSATTTKAITIEAAIEADKGEQMQALRITRVDEGNSDGIQISGIPLTVILEAAEVKDGEGKAEMKAISLVPAKVVPMKKIVME